jgi:hypothetical protein
MEIERGSTRSHPVENSLWKGLRTWRKTDYRMNEWMNGTCKVSPPSSQNPLIEQSQNSINSADKLLHTQAHIWLSVIIFEETDLYLQ